MKRYCLLAFCLLLTVSSSALGQTASGCATLLSDQAAAADWLACTLPLADQAIADTRILSTDAMEGRAPATPGSTMARAYLAARLEAIGALPLFESYEQPFTFREAAEGPLRHGINLVARIAGTETDGKIIAVTAHYDHFGVSDGEIYNGADDNASGVAGVLALAQALVLDPPRHTTILAFVDAEELGFFGAYALVDDPRFPLADIGLNLNLDMISKNSKGELYAAGGAHNRSIKALIGDLVPISAVTLLQGHDVGDNEVLEDWTEESDHIAFHRKDIPWLYFGVEDHAEYHEPSDDFATMPLDFYRGSIATVIAAFRLFDQNLESVTPPDALGN